MHDVWPQPEHLHGTRVIRALTCMRTHALFGDVSLVICTQVICALSWAKVVRELRTKESTAGVAYTEDEAKKYKGDIRQFFRAKRKDPPTATGIKRVAKRVGHSDFYTMCVHGRHSRQIQNQRQLQFDTLGHETRHGLAWIWADAALLHGAAYRYDRTTAPETCHHNADQPTVTRILHVFSICVCVKPKAHAVITSRR